MSRGLQGPAGLKMSQGGSPSEPRLRTSLMALWAPLKPANGAQELPRCTPSRVPTPAVHWAPAMLCAQVWCNPHRAPLEDHPHITRKTPRLRAMKQLAQGHTGLWGRNVEAWGPTSKGEMLRPEEAPHERLEAPQASSHTFRDGALAHSCRGSLPSSGWHCRWLWKGAHGITMCRLQAASCHGAESVPFYPADPLPPPPSGHVWFLPSCAHLSAAVRRPANEAVKN